MLKGKARRHLFCVFRLSLLSSQPSLWYMVVAINDGYIRFRSDLARFRLAKGYIYMSIPISGVLIIIYTIVWF